MKKHFLWVFLPFLALQSCSISKEVRQQRNLISGTWILTDISYENNEGSFSATLFNDADAICFEDSNWFFRDNNSTGRYTIKQGSLCEGGDRSIRWSVLKNPESYSSQLQFKFIDDKRKDISGGLGYRLNIERLTATEMRLKSNVRVDGEAISVIYEFQKN